MTDLERFTQEVLERGPTRVLISPVEGVPPQRAREVHGINPDVIFIRRDGWSLGAPKRFATAAERMWADEWIGKLTRPNTIAEPYPPVEPAGDEWTDARDVTDEYVSGATKVLP